MTQPTFKQLEAIYQTGQLGSFQAAAKHLHTSQSAIAKRIAELESMFDVELIDLKHRRAKLTETGLRLMRGAEGLLIARGRLINDMMGSEGFKGTLRLGASELVAVTWLPTFFEQLRLAYPDVVVDLTVRQGLLLLDSLKAGALHMAFVGGPFWDVRMESVELQDVEFAWMASPRLLIPQTVLTASDLSGYPLLVHTPEGVVSRIFEDWQRKAGFKLQRVITANSLTVLIEMAISGLGISPLPVEYAKRHLEDGSLVRLRTNPALPRIKYFAVHQNPTDFPLTTNIAQLALQIAGQWRGKEIKG
jgi:DNA-binding transcriptional LysR family regulator